MVAEETCGCILNFLRHNLVCLRKLSHLFVILASVLCVQFDSNGDGQISLTELREAMKKLMGEQVTNREINEILRDVDLNGDGLVDFEGKINLFTDIFTLKAH